MAHRTGILYIELLKKAITNSLYPWDADARPTPRELSDAETALERAFQKFGAMVTSEEHRDAVRMLCMTPEEMVATQRANSKRADALTAMSGVENLQRCVETVINEKIPGDLMECGVWRGGLCVFMAGLLKAHEEDRRVWVADSFEGLPTPDPMVSLQDAVLHELLGANSLSVSLEEVQDIFRRYDLLDSRVRFLQGWFDQTIPSAPVEALAVLRVDADYYESTRTCLAHLYPKLAVGGFLILDDYGLPLGERQAVDEYRQKYGITDPLQQVNHHEFFWRKTR